jgi:hypothetical protein
MQDCIAWLGMKGFDMDKMIDMDILSLNELLASVSRLDGIEKADRTYAALMAAQGEGGAVLDWIQKTYLQGVEPAKPEEKSSDLNKFLNDFKGGI